MMDLVKEVGDIWLLINDGIVEKWWQEPGINNWF